MKLLRILTFLRLGDNAEDPAVAMRAIERGVVFKGTNLLILVFAILIASVGLNMNSTAVIIGAMLISPLMGPIIGVGAGVGTMDLRLVERALKNFGFAVVASLSTSALYFLLSPLSDAHSEILARTSPTIWDVLIALAGGFAGIIAAASKERGNVVPGVAIATALMPPLCTAGYGLAHLNWPFFFGALYLFLINSVFISMATLFTVRWLGFPEKTLSNPNAQKRVRQLTAAIVLFTVVPSIYLAYRLVKQNTFQHQAEAFVANDAVLPENYLVDHTINAARRSIDLVFVGTGLGDQEREALRKRLAVYNIPDASLSIRSGLSLNEIAEKDRQTLDVEERKRQEEMALLSRFRALNDSLQRASVERRDLYQEAKAQHPTLLHIGLVDVPAGGMVSDSIDVLILAQFARTPDTSEVGRLKRWLAVKLAPSHFDLAIALKESGRPQ